jgi:hypothetical protein
MAATSSQTCLARTLHGYRQPSGVYSESIGRSTPSAGGYWIVPALTAGYAVASAGPKGADQISAAFARDHSDLPVKKFQRLRNARNRDQFCSDVAISTFVKSVVGVRIPYRGATRGCRLCQCQHRPQTPNDLRPESCRSKNRFAQPQKEGLGWNTLGESETRKARCAGSVKGQVTLACFPDVSRRRV